MIVVNTELDCRVDGASAGTARGCFFNINFGGEKSRSLVLRGLSVAYKFLWVKERTFATPNYACSPRAGRG